jgi:hypothetical protein
MLQQTCARKFCRGQARGDDRRHDQPAIPRRPATPCREHKDFLRPKDLSRSKHGAVTAFLCDFLVERGVTPVKVLKTAGLPHATHDDWRDTDAVQALYTAVDPFMPDTVVSDTDSAATGNSGDSQAPSPLMIVLESSFCLCRSVQGLFFLSLFLFSFSPGFLHGGMYMEDMSFTTPFATRRLRFLKSTRQK